MVKFQCAVPLSGNFNHQLLTQRTQTFTTSHQYDVLEKMNLFSFDESEMQDNSRAF
jgi:hypothetical protein